MRYLILFVLALVLAGCGSNKRGSDLSQDRINFGPPPRTEAVPVPPDNSAAMSALKNELRTETTNDIHNAVNHSADQMSGLVTAKVGQLAEKLTGVEANLRTEFRAEANLSAAATANLTAKVDSNITTTAEMRADLKIVASMQATISAQATLMNDMKATIDKLQAQLSATTAAQVGLSNSLTSMQAGRDTNALTPEAVRLVLGITGGLFLLLTTVIVLVVRSAYAAATLRETNRAKSEAEERRQTTSLLMEVLGGNAMTPETKSRVRSLGQPPTGFYPKIG